MPNASFFPLFHQLSSIKSDERVSGVTDLKALLLQEGKEEELDYTMTRLVRGLTSSRAAARQGFALGLCTLIRDGVITDLEKVFAKLQEETKASGLKGEEERDKLLGRVFGLLALVRSGKLPSALKVDVAKALCDLTKEKAWFKDVSTFCLCNLIESCSATNTDEDEQVLHDIAKVAAKKMEEDSLDLNAVQLAIVRQLGADGEEVSKTLERINKKRLGAATALHHERMGIVWEQLVLCAKAAADEGLAQRIFTEFVDDLLLRGNAASKERKACAWRLFAKLALAQPRAVPHMLQSKNLLNACLGLKPAPVDAYEAILTACALAPEIKPAVVSTLLDFGDFDGKTRSKTMATLVSDDSTTEALVGDLVSKFQLGGADNDALVDSLFDLGKIHAANAKLLQTVLEFLFKHSGENAHCRRRFHSLLTRSKPEDFLPLLRRFAPKPAAEEEEQTFADDKRGRAFEAIYLYLSLLQMDDEERVEEAESILEDLVQCANGQQEEEDVLTVVNILLALSAQPNAMLRDLVKQLTRCLAPKIAASPAAIDLLVGVLVVSKRTQGEGDDEDGDDEEDGGEEVEEDAASASGSSSSEDDEEEEEHEEDGEIDAEEMEAYDRALGEMIKSRLELKPKASEKDQATAQALVFKLRVLDLLEIILTKTGAAALVESLPTLLGILQDSAVQPSAQTKRRILVEPTNAVFNRLQAIVRKLLSANQVGELQCFAQVLDIATTLLKKTKQDQLLKIGADALCFLALRESSSPRAEPAAMQLVATQLLPLLLLGHVNCKLLFTSLSLLAEKTSEVDALTQALISVTPRTQFQGELQLELLFKLLKRKAQNKPGNTSSSNAAPDLAPIFFTEQDLSPKRQRLLLRCMQFYCKSFPTKLAARQIDSVVKRIFEKTNSPPVKQLCQELVSDKALLGLTSATGEDAGGGNKKKARLSVEERKSTGGNNANTPKPTPEAKKARVQSETKQQQQKKKD